VVLMGKRLEKVLPECPECKTNTKVVKFGTIPTRYAGVKQRFRCQKCASTFYKEYEGKD
jgi:transposase-like protein